MPTQGPQKVFIVSDATGETAEKVVQAALLQFPASKVKIRYFLKKWPKCETFEWSDFSPLDYEAWLPDEPNNWEDNEDCVSFAQFDDTVPGKHWNDEGCGQYNSHVCEVYLEDFHLSGNPKNKPQFLHFFPVFPA